MSYKKNYYIWYSVFRNKVQNIDKQNMKWFGIDGQKDAHFLMLSYKKPYSD